MLKICNDLLIAVDAAYLAFRLACRDTLERMVMSEQVGIPGDGPCGYLAEVPFLKNVPPQVQVDLLLETWHKLTQPETVSGTLVDESVIYAACETAARLVSSDRGTAERLLSGGPRQVSLPPNAAAVQQIHALHLDLSNEGNFLLISQFQDIPPVEARILKAKFGLPEPTCDVMFDVLGRWHVAPQIRVHAAGLLTPRELRRAEEVLIAAVSPDSARSSEFASE